MYSEDITAQSLVSISNLFSLICSEWFCFLLCGMMMNRNRTVVESFREHSSRGLIISFILMKCDQVVGCFWVDCVANRYLLAETREYNHIGDESDLSMEFQHSFRDV